LVEENRKQYLERVREKEKAEELKRKEHERREKKIAENQAMWERDVLPNWD
jgi:hypothetical protein